MLADWVKAARHTWAAYADERGWEVHGQVCNAAAGARNGNMGVEEGAPVDREPAHIRAPRLEEVGADMCCFRVEVDTEKAQIRRRLAVLPSKAVRFLAGRCCPVQHMEVEGGVGQQMAGPKHDRATYLLPHGCRPMRCPVNERAIQTRTGEHCRLQ